MVSGGEEEEITVFLVEPVSRRATASSLVIHKEEKRFNLDTKLPTVFLLQ